MKRKIKTELWVLFLVVVAMVLVGLAEKEPERVTSTYVVQTGDRLYDIATKMGVDDWRKWCYEVCRMNNIKDGGTIHVGDELIIYKEVE